MTATHARPVQRALSCCVTLFLTVALSGCGDDASPAAPGGFAERPVRVVTTPAEMRPISRTLEAIGTTYANESVVITAKVTDSVMRVNFEDGDVVNEGDVLVELTNREETALLAEAQANVEDAERQYERLQDLLTRQSVPVSQVDEALAKFDAAQARYQSIVARLADRLVTAPFAGVLGFRQVSPGTIVTPGTEITTLDDISTVKLDFRLAEVHLGLLQPGQAVAATSPAWPDSRFPAQVTSIGSRVDPVTRTALVRARIDNPDMRLRPGMLMVVKLTTRERRALMVPETALLQRGERVFVYTLDAEDRAVATDVERGQRLDGWVEVISGLQPGEEVISEGLVKVRNNGIVQRTEAAEQIAEQIEPDSDASDS